MESNWYPKNLMVREEGNQRTIDFLTSVYSKSKSFRYAEFGFYLGATAKRVHKLFPKSELHLFDYYSAIQKFKDDNVDDLDRYFFYGNTQRYNDSYNWNLMKLIDHNSNDTIFDYCYLDGAHTVAIDALNYFLVDKLLNTGGYIEFDDYYWSLRGSSLDPLQVPETAIQYTDEQIDSKQVKMIVDILVKTDQRYEEVVENRIYKKISP